MNASKHPKRLQMRFLSIKKSISLEMVGSKVQLIKTNRIYQTLEDSTTEMYTRLQMDATNEQEKKSVQNKMDATKEQEKKHVQIKVDTTKEQEGGSVGRTRNKDAWWWAEHIVFEYYLRHQLHHMLPVNEVSRKILSDSSAWLVRFFFFEIFLLLTLLR